MLVAYVAITVEVGNEFGLTTNAQRLLPITMTLFIYGAVAVATGYLADRFDALKMLTVGIAISTAAAFGIAASLNYYMLLAFMGVLGVGLGFYHPVGLSYISKVFGPRNRGKALGINGIGGNTGWLLSPIATAFIAVNFGWRWAYVVWGCLGLAFIILVLYLFGSGTLAGNNNGRDEPGEEKEAGNGKRKRRKRSGNGVVDRKNLEAQSEEAVTPTSAADYKMGLRRMLTFLALIVMLITIFRGFYFHGLTDTLPTFLQVEKPELLASDDPGVKIILAGGFLSLLYMMGIIAEPLGGWIKDRYEARRPIVLASLANAGSLVLLIYADTALLLTLAVTSFGFCFLLLMSVVNATIADVTPPQVRGTFFGLTFLTRDGIGAFAPLFVGFVADGTGSFLNAYWVLAVAAVVTAMLGLTLKRGKQEQVE
jgi:MFS family permease